MSRKHGNFPAQISTTQFVKLHIFDLLNRGDKYGQSIIDSIEERLEGKWKPSPGMVYPLLRQFEEEGYIRGSWLSESKRTIRLYSLTQDGYNHFNSVKKTYIEKLENSKKIIELTIKYIY